MKRSDNKAITITDGILSYRDNEGRVAGVGAAISRLDLDSRGRLSQSASEDRGIGAVDVLFSVLPNLLFHLLGNLCVIAGLGAAPEVQKDLVRLLEPIMNREGKSGRMAHAGIERTFVVANTKAPLRRRECGRNLTERQRPPLT